MEFTLSERQVAWRDRARAFINDHVRSAHAALRESPPSAGADRWQVPAVVEELKARAYSEGLWNLFLPPSTHDDDEYHGAGLSNLTSEQTAS